MLNLFQGYSVVLLGPFLMRLLKNETLKVSKDTYQCFVHVSSKSRKILINFVARPKVPSNILPIKLKTRATKFFVILQNATKSLF